MLAIAGRTVGLGGISFAIGVMILLFDFSLYEAIGFTQIYILAGTLTSMCLKITTKHPRLDRPMIEFDLLTQILAPILLGISIGSHAALSVPIWLIFLLFVVAILSIFSYMIYKLKEYLKNLNNTTPENYKNIGQVMKINQNRSNNEAESPKFNNNDDIENRSFSHHNIIENHNSNGVETEQGALKDLKNYQNSSKKKDNDYAEFFLAQDKKTFSVFRLVYFIPLLIVSVLLSNSPQSPSVVGVGSCSKYYPLLLSLYAAFVICTNIASS